MTESHDFPYYLFWFFKLTSYWNVIQRLRSEFKSSCCHTTIDMAIFGQQCTITGMWLPDIAFHEQGHVYCPELLSCARLDIEILFLRIVVIDKYLSMMTLAVFNFGNLTKTTLLPHFFACKVLSLRIDRSGSNLTWWSHPSSMSKRSSSKESTDILEDLILDIWIKAKKPLLTLLSCYRY